MQIRPANILLVDDSSADAKLIRRWLSESRLVGQVDFVSDGRSALSFLAEQLPDLVLLDVNLPQMGGFEVLQQIKSDPRLASIPVIVLTGSTAREDAARAVELQAALCLVKPWDADEFARLVETVESLWRERAGEQE